MEMLSEIVEMISTTQIQVILIAFIVIVVISNRRKRTSFKGAQVWPVVGLLPSLLFHFGDLYDWFTHLAILNGGTFRLPGPWKTKIFTADPANVEYVLRTRYHNFGKGDYFKDAFRDLLDGSLLVEDGERFRLLNKSVAMTLSSTEFRNTAAAAIPAAVHQKLLPVFRRAAENNTPIDLQDVFHRLAFDNICIVGFGVDPGSLSLDLHRDPILEASEGAMEAMMLRMFMPAICWKTMRYFNVGQERRLRIGREILYGFANEVFRRRGVDDSPSNLSDIMSGFIRVERESGRDYSEKQSLLALMVGLILAGKDNVKAGLTWFFWNLARHPEVEAKIVAELRDILERREIRDDSAPFSFEEVKAMDYLHAALSESLRLYPPVPEETTEPAEEDVLPDGTPVEKGAQLVYLIYASGRLESVWGKDCLEFKPERWLKNDVFVRESDFKFMVFNGGPRRCTGRDYAYSQMKWAAASILIRYRVEILDKHRVLPKFGAVLSMKYGLVAAIHPRAEACKCIK